MIFFITVLRALAAVIITNSHYVGVYPTDLIANGGLYGDVIFFAVSGFCLVNAKESFPRWYGKRLLRIFPTVVLISVVYCALGLFDLEMSLGGIVNMFIYPTAYHFIASILVLYIPFYIVAKSEVLRKRIPLIAAVLGAIWFVIYIFMYDKSYYHIDAVREPMIRFLFFFAMLLGAYFRINKDRFLNKKAVLAWVALPILFVSYFASKMLFSRMQSVAYLQIVNQIILLAVLAATFRCFASIDGKLERLPKALKNIISFISGITLEIYLVQIGIIDRLNILPFPLNWILITTIIILLAFLLHKISQFVQKPILNKLSKESKHE